MADISIILGQSEERPSASEQDGQNCRIHFGIGIDHGRGMSNAKLAPDTQWHECLAEAPNPASRFIDGGCGGRHRFCDCRRLCDVEKGGGCCVFNVRVSTRHAEINSVGAPGIVLTFLAAGLSMLCAWIMGRYDVQVQGDPSAASASASTDDSTSFFRAVAHIIIAVEVKPRTFVTAIFLYAAAVALIYYRHRHDEHQDAFLIAASCLSIGVGLIESADPRRVLLGVFPVVIALTLLTSACAHHWYRRTGRLSDL